IAANHTVEVGGHVQATVQGHHTLHAGQRIERQTQRYELRAGEKAIIHGPGGSIVLDESGVTIEGLQIHLKGEVESTNATGTHVSQLLSNPVPGLPPDAAPHAAGLSD
ncbi:hypothetical protein, partial [Dyella sp. ASV21]|uniref:hypothetical protein n=1 Tax=Dyella sp. ASV21 TaxID=2795114 RepID=UPI0018ED830C